MKRKKDKGFTLVELIVVLVILAILAAILVPALLGYIDRAKEKQYVLNAKSALTATQAEFSSMYGEGEVEITQADFGTVSGTTFTAAARSTTIKNTADTPADTHFYVAIIPAKKSGEGDTAASVGAVKDNHDHYTVKAAYYTEKGYVCLFNGKTWTTTESKTAPAIPNIEGVTTQPTAWVQIY